MTLFGMTVRRGSVAVIAVIGGLSAAWVGESLAHRQAERRYQETIKARQQLELEVGELRADREQLAANLTASEQHVIELDQAVAAKEAELKSVVVRLGKEQQAVQELDGKLVAMQYQFDRVQGQLALALEQRSQQQASAEPAAVQLDRVVVTPPGGGAPGLEGRILSVNTQWNFIVVNLGWNVVQLGDVVSIYRGEQLVAKAKVERVQEQVAAATLLPEWMRSDIQVNDVVRIL